MPTLTRSERDAVIDLIIADLTPHKALEMLEDPDSRRLLVDQALIVDELGLDGPRQDAYPVERSLPELRRTLRIWCAAADEWLRAHAARQERATEAERAEHREEYRLELWTTCRTLLDRLEEVDDP